jgi:hypothetical protein
VEMLAEILMLIAARNGGRIRRTETVEGPLIKVEQRGSTASARSIAHFGPSFVPAGRDCRCQGKPMGVTMALTPSESGECRMIIVLYRFYGRGSRCGRIAVGKLSPLYPRQV